MTWRRAPGPPAHPLWGHVEPFRRDVLRLLLDSRREYGDVVRFRLGPGVVHLLAHPDHVRTVLVDRHANYDKDTRSSRHIRRVTGSGLLSSNGELWLRQRRLMQPAFHASRVESFVGEITAATVAMLDAWQGRIDAGQPIDITSEMMRLTCTIVSQVLLGADVRDELPAIERAATAVMEHVYDGIQRIVPVPSWLPTPRQQRFRDALGTLDRIVERIIDDRLRRPAGDLVSTLLGATGAGDRDATPMPRAQVRNEVLTLLMAGHETTANSLVWLFHLLAAHEAIATDVHREVRDVLGTRPPEAADLRRLPRTERAIREAMRLFPPIWILERRARAADAIDGFDIPAGSMVVLSPFVTHRHPAFWPDAERFDPDRFAAGDDDRPDHPHAYFPFGAGQRRCIGASLAMAEALGITAMVMQRVRLAHAGPPALEPQPGVTLRAARPLMMTAHAWRD